MEEIEKTELILSLIEDNLINRRLINGLNDLGLTPDNYCLHLGDMIFKLMGFKSSPQSDLIFEKVFKANSNISSTMNFPCTKEELRELSQEIYNDLLFAKEVCQPKQS
jgi:hypothetical protein